MTNFIKEFYYGNIHPLSRITKQNETVQICDYRKYSKVIVDIYFTKIIVFDTINLPTKLIQSYNLNTSFFVCNTVEYNYNRYYLTY